MKQSPRYAVVVWKGDGNYDRDDIIAVYVSAIAADNKANKLNITEKYFYSCVVRSLKYIRGGGTI